MKIALLILIVFVVVPLLTAAFLGTPRDFHG